MDVGDENIACIGRKVVKMKNYVKGEWRLNNYHHPYQYIVAHGGPEDNDAFPSQRKICDIWDWNTETGKANAHLITSAPALKQQLEDYKEGCKGLKLSIQDIKQQRDDLLEACKEALKYFVQFDIQQGTISGISLQLQDAITKCEA